MTGTIINVAAIVVGSLIGIFFGARLSDKLKSTIIAGMGLFLVAMGIQMFLKTENSLIVLAAILLGTLLGEWWRIGALVSVVNIGIWMLVGGLWFKVLGYW